MRTGDVPPPPGYSATDFEIPTLRQVLNAFPNTSINIEIKMIKTLNNDTTTGSGCTGSPPNRYCDDPDASIPVADKLASLLNETKYASRNDLIVVSFSDELLAEFHRLDGPPYVALAGATNGTTIFPSTAASLIPTSRLQGRPTRRRAARTSRCPSCCSTTRRAHCLGYAVHTGSTETRTRPTPPMSASTTRVRTA